jgi:hypothetical protein
VLRVTIYDDAADDGVHDNDTSLRAFFVTLFVTV